MADEIIIFDAAGSNLDGTNPGSALSIGPGTSYGLLEHSYPQAPLNVLYASSIDTEGEIPASRRSGNRTITIKLDMVDAAGTLLAALQAKFTKLQREGGTLKRTLKNGDVRIYDIIAGDGWDPVYDLKYYLGDLTEVSMTLPARPFSRGAEVDLGDNVETTLPLLIFTEATVAGDVPALGRLVIDNDTASSSQRLMRWGIQSRYYSSASTAALFYEAESCAGSNPFPLAGASGGANNTSQTGTLPLTGGWQTLITVGANATAQTHIGTYRVFTRAWAFAANTGVVSLRLTWQPGIGQAQISNSSVSLTTPAGVALEDTWLLVDLGMVTLPKAVAGTQGWLGLIEGNSTVLNDDAALDWVMLLPVDEGSGEYFDKTSLIAQLAASGSVQVRHDSVLAATSGGYLSPLNVYEGDYLLVPPSGAEARTLRVIVKLARADTTNSTSEVVLDAGIDDLSARLFVTPRYIT